jgi:hypothetical protein
LLTALGTGVGIALACAIVGTVNHYTGELLPDALPYAMGGRALGGTAVVASGVALLVGLLPIVPAFGGSQIAGARDMGRRSSPGRGVRTWGNSLIVAQVAIAVILLTGAGLLIRSFAHVLAIDPGFNPHHVIAARIALTKDADADDRARLFERRLEAALGEIPGCTASLATATPFLLLPQVRVSMPIDAIDIRNPAAPGGRVRHDAYRCGASANYLTTMQIPLLAGRWFNDADTATSRPVAVVDEDFARRYFPGRSAVGQRVMSDAEPHSGDENWWEIIGVVGNVHHNGIEDSSGNPFLYRPLAQASLIDGELSVLVRTQRPTGEMLTLLRERVAALDPELPVYAAATMEAVVSRTFTGRR